MRFIAGGTRRAPLAVALLVALVLPAACANDGSSSSADTAAETGTHQLSGVVPEPVPDGVSPCSSLSALRMKPE